VPWTDPRRYRSDAILREAMKILAAGAMALSVAACSLSVGVIGPKDEEPEATGAIATKAAVPLSPDLNEEDWRRAKAALAVALDPQGPGTQVSWDNPQTGIKGSFTPAGAPFVKNDEICRAFSAHLSGPTGGALQGSACRPSGGEWVVKEVRPVKGAAKV
jgi:surface antigen